MNYLIRSLLFIPADDKHKLLKSLKTNADVLAFDLEDSVYDIDSKQLGRINISNILKYSNKIDSYKIFIRINDIESGELLKDLIFLTNYNNFEGFIYPKVKTQNDIIFIDKLLESLEYEHKLSIGIFKLIILFETTQSILNINEIITASNRIVSIAFGGEDYITDLGGNSNKKNNYLSFLTPRSIISIAAKAHNVIPLDTVHVNLNDLNDLKNIINMSKDLGFEGMLLLHPKEIDIVNSKYSPSEDEVNYANKIIYQKNNNTKSVFIINNNIIGPPMIKHAENVLQKYYLIQNENNNNRRKR